MLKLTRENVEKSIDECEAEGVENFLKKYNFGKGKYYVRSIQRKLKEKKYPSLAIALHAMNIKASPYDQNKAGWSYKVSACPMLYNIGYIILDRQCKVVRSCPHKGKICNIPSDIEFLIDENEWISKVVTNYHIEPKRETGESRIELNIAELVNEIGSFVKSNDIAKVLKSPLFNVTAGVELETEGFKKSKDIEKYSINLNPSIYSDSTDIFRPSSKENLEGGRVVRGVALLERSAMNRKRALEIHGYKCSACGFSMEELYGKDAKDIIDIHHKYPLSMLSGKTKIDCKEDLVPLCPNCHRVAHKGVKEPRKPQEVGKLFEKFGKKLLKHS